MADKKFSDFKKSDNIDSGYLVGYNGKDNIKISAEVIHEKLKGDDGFSPEIKVKTQSKDEYVLEITTSNGSFETPNLLGGNSFNIGDFSFVIEDGDLYLIKEEGMKNPFEYDEETGNLYYKID